MKATLEKALSCLSLELQKALMPYLSSPEFDATFTQEQVKALSEQTNLNQTELALSLLPLAAAYSIAPISQFFVGAIAIGQSGRFYFGANREFVGEPLNQSIHAEQSAISHAWLKGETKLIKMVINCTPCGHYRQFMNELNEAVELEIQLPEKPAAKLHDYLPNAFGPADLNTTERLLLPIAPRFFYANDQQDPLIEAGLSAINKSHAPYSKSPSGIAIRTHDNQIITGCYAENAAFNPSFAPLQVGLNLMNFAGYKPQDIKDVLLFECKNAVIKQDQTTQNMLFNLTKDVHYQCITL